MAKNKKSYTETDVLLVTIAMPVLALIILLIAVAFNQKAGPANYMDSFDSSFYQELIAVLIGYSLAFILTILAFRPRLARLGNKYMPIGIGWLAVTLLFWRYQAMGLKSLDCGGHGYSSTCTHLLPNRLDDMITVGVAVTLVIFGLLAYGWLRVAQQNK